MRRSLSLPILALCSLAITVSACGKKPEAELAAAPAAPADDKKEQAVDQGLELPEGAKVMILEPAMDAVYVVAPGATKAKIHVRFGVEKMEVKPAGEIIPGSGHHHLIINDKTPEFGQPVPKSETASTTAWVRPRPISSSRPATTTSTRSSPTVLTSPTASACAPT